MIAFLKTMPISIKNADHHRHFDIDLWVMRRADDRAADRAENPRSEMVIGCRKLPNKEHEESIYHFIQPRGPIAAWGEEGLNTRS